MGFPRQEYWSGLPFSFPEFFSNPGIKPISPALADISFTTELLGKYMYLNTAAAAAKSLQLCPTLCDPRDGSPPGFPVPGFLQVGTPE